MFKIMCFSSGEYIKLSSLLAMRQIRLPGIPPDIKAAMPAIIDLAYGCRGNWEYLEFETLDAAKWFISHRLIYNPRRNNVKKLSLMKDTFEYNNIPGWQTIKLEFEVSEC